jgi:hypothetical protein
LWVCTRRIKALLVPSVVMAWVLVPVIQIQGTCSERKRVSEAAPLVTSLGWERMSGNGLNYDSRYC